MKYQFRVEDAFGNEVPLKPWENIQVAVKSVEHIPSIGDPEDPNDDSELVLHLVVLEENRSG